MTDVFKVVKATGLAAKTTGAYMYSIYGHKDWVQCIVFMMDIGIHEDLIEWILRSKHMRWADGDSMEDGYGIDSFKEYWRANRNNVQDDARNTLNQERL